MDCLSPEISTRLDDKSSVQQMLATSCEGCFLWNALGLRFHFSVIILAIEIRWNLRGADMPEKKGWASLCLVSDVAGRLLIPWNVVGTICADFLGSRRYRPAGLYPVWPGDRLITTTQDLWARGSRDSCGCSGTGRPLVGAAGLLPVFAIPSPIARYYQAARIESGERWKVFRYIELPKMMGVIDDRNSLLRLMDSFMILIPNFVVTGGGPRYSYTFPVDRILVKNGAPPFFFFPGGGPKFFWGKTLVLRRIVLDSCIILVILLISPMCFYTVVRTLIKGDGH